MAACDALAPQDPVRRHAWLFKSVLVDLGDGSTRGGFTEHEDEVSARRVAALTEIVTGGGLPAVFELARETEYPALVGLSLAADSDDFDREMTSALVEPDPAVRGWRTHT